FFICNYDYVIDAIDTITGKIGLVVECNRRGIRIISSMGAGNKLDPTQFKVADIYETTVDPIAKVMRKKLKEHGINKLKVIYSTESPIQINNKQLNQNGSPSLKVIGSISFVPSVAGLILAGEVIKEIAGI
ncbi:MAG: tRNA threonylcarbamoyladenosine dehydratase, partial [Selenomonadaceae bacterium]|nr:tRNA threonylcarbamoyladenosine dehydratase [Selenomonadaceae bacterium]